MVSDSPKAYEGVPAFEFIRNAPATWDETRVLMANPENLSPSRDATEETGSWEALPTGMRGNWTCRWIS